MMNQRNIWRKITALLLLGLLLLPVLAQENEIAITARQNLALQSKPDYDSDVLGVFPRGQEADAFGRDEAGAWLQINDGWIAAKNVDAAGDVMGLPVTTNAVTVKAASGLSLRSGPDGSFDMTGNLPSGETALALGRNGGGSWLQVADGWIPADQVEISGDVMALPITFSSITIGANINVALRRGPSRDAEVVAILARGESAVATSRNEAGTAVQTTRGWVFINRGLALEGEVMDLPLAPTVSVIAVQSLTLYRWPALNSDSLSVVQQGEQDIAFGRNEAGDWLEIPGGWVSAEQGLELDGDVMRLPITGQTGIIITPILPGGSSIRSRPHSTTSNRVVGHLRKGEEALAIGRNEDGKWLQIESGWVLAAWVKADGDIMDLLIIGQAGITITATHNVSVRTGSSALSDRVGSLGRGEEALAIGRSQGGYWLRIENGWILASPVKADGDIMDLPIISEESSTQSTAKASSGDSITVTATRSTPVPVRIRSSASSDRVRSLGRGEEAIAFGRNKAGTWLRIEDGWVFASWVKVDGDIMSLPITSGESSAQSIAKTSSRDGVTITSTAGSTIRSEPRFGRNVIGNLQRGEEAVAIGRTERGSWLQIESGWVSASFVKASGDIMTLPVTSGESSAQSIAKASPRDGITITLKYDILSVWSRPSVASDHDRVGSLQRGEGALAIGRNKTGTWLRIEDGWVVTNMVKIDGDIMDLPITSGESSTQSIAKTSPRDGIIVTAKYLISVSSGSGTSGRVGRLQRGEEALAIGRNEDGTKLQIESGWVLANMVRVDGDIMLLPVTSEESSTQSIAKTSPRDGVTIKATLPRGSVIRSEPRTIGNSTVGSLQRGEETVAIGRNKAGTYLQIESGWVLAAWVKADGDIMSLPITSGESSAQSIAKVSSRNGVTIKTTLLLGSSIRSRPTIKANLVGSLQRDEEAVAIGRNEDGRWLRIEDGWVLASYVKADGDIMLLPVTSGESSTQSVAKASPRDGVTITLSRFDSFPVRNAPRSDVSVRFLQKGEEALAVGRDQAGTWLQIEDGWVYGDYFRVDGDLMDLPVTSSTVARTATTSTRATPTPARSASSASAFNEQTIRSRVNRYTDDVRILKISQSGGTTSIEYDLKPWHFVPNEQIAHEVLFKMICALRRGGQIPHKLEFIGQGHFKSDVGRKFKSPSVEIHISANNANRIVCSGNNYTDINWRSLASRYKSYPIPSGARVDYD